MEEQKKNYQLFFDLFKEIEDYLLKIVREEIRSFPNLISKACEIRPSIRKYSGELNDLSLIRTLLAHKKRENLILIPDTTIKKTKAILNYIKNPPTVLKKFGKKVFTCKLEDSLLEIIKVMKERVYTHIPVYSYSDLNEKEFVGVLSESSIMNWLADKKEISLKNVKIEELVEFLNKQPNECFDFVNKDEDAYKIKERFLKEVKDQKRIGAIFITKNGNKDEELLGIITAWDLPLLD